MLKLNQAYFSVVLNKNPTIQQQIRYLSFFEKSYFSACLNALLNEQQKISLQSVIQQTKITLPRNFSKKKTLFIDLDHTLIITANNKNQIFSQTFHFKDADINFSVRPHAIQFLKKASSFYQIILFTSSIANYTIQFFNYLNSKSNYCIKKCLSRQNCIQFKPHVYIQDIRIIKNRQFQKVLFLSHNVLCFRQTPQNGLPIPLYDGSPNDRQLLFILDFLIKISGVQDVRKINKETFNIRKIYFPKGEEHDQESCVKTLDDTKC